VLEGIEEVVVVVVVNELVVVTGVELEVAELEDAELEGGVACISRILGTAVLATAFTFSGCAFSFSGGVSPMTFPFVGL
jgi:hypothetical protein